MSAEALQKCSITEAAIPPEISRTNHTLGIYHASWFLLYFFFFVITLSMDHQTPPYHVEAPGRLNLLIELLGELEVKYPGLVIASNPAKGSLIILCC